MSKIDRNIARHFPDLGLPVMSDAARKALQTIMRYDKSISSFAYDKIYRADIKDELTLAWARGYVCDPSDWAPYPQQHQMHVRYQPWAEWMAENGMIRLFRGCTLTRDNWHLWKPDETRDEIRHLLRYNPEKAYDLLLNNAVHDSAAHRERMMWQFSRPGEGGFGAQPADKPVIAHFLKDRSGKVRAKAQEHMNRIESSFSDADVAAALAALPGIKPPPDRRDGPVLTLAEWLEKPAVQERLDETLQSVYDHAIRDLLGPSLGILTHDIAKRYQPYSSFEASITRELETGELPVNWHYDPFRSLGLVVDKPTAKHLLDRARALGMPEDHPRLSPLQFNIAL